MWVIKLFRIISGYVCVTFSGDFCERILNLCAKNHITLWNIKRIDEKITANVTVKNFKKLKNIRGKSKVKIKINKKNGIPFITRKYKLRVGLCVGVIIFFSILIFLQSFVWQIYVTGNEEISENKIINACSKLGIGIGTPINKINTSKSKEELLLNVEGIAWGSLNIEGCRLTINISENKNEVAQKNIPSNLYAKTDGVIKKIDVKSGYPCVKVGDAVLKGDLLDSGVIELPNAQVTEYVKSNAEIIATTEHKLTASTEKTNYELNETGIKSKKSVLEIFGLEIPLFLGEEKPPYRFNVYEYNFSLFGEKMPVYIKTKQFERLEYKKVFYDSEQAKELAVLKIENTLKNGNFLKYSLLSENLTEENDCITVERQYKCEENIVYEQILSENDLK